MSPEDLQQAIEELVSSCHWAEDASSMAASVEVFAEKFGWDMTDFGHWDKPAPTRPASR